LNNGSKAVQFDQVMEDVKEWLSNNNLDGPDYNNIRDLADTHPSTSPPVVPNFAVVTCGNWDLKTQIPKQCAIVGCPVPNWCDSWINLKDIWNRLYTWKVSGMDGMATKLQIKGRGFHHLGMHDTECIARVLVHILQDGAKVNITGRRVD